MEICISALLSASSSTMGFFGLIFFQTKKRTIFLYFLYYMFLFFFIAPHIGQWTTIFLIAGACLIVWCTFHHILYIALSLVGYFICVLLNHVISIPANFAGISIANIISSCFLWDFYCSSPW